MNIQPINAASISRPVMQNNVKAQVAGIITSVRNNGDTAIKKLTKQFDGISLNTINQEIRVKNIDSDIKSAIDVAYENIRQFHLQQIPENIRLDIQPGVVCEKRYRPFEKIGLYIPGGTAPLISTLLMLAIPANIAGVKTIEVCTPPRQDQSIDNVLAYCAAKCGIERVATIGGAQAIAAMAYGTASISKVDKIFGPGNSWVTEAKVQVATDLNGAAIDMPAGPSEVLVIADNAANADFVAADLLAQAEHGVDSQAICVCLSWPFAERVWQALEKQKRQLSRQAIIAESMKNIKIYIANTIAQAIGFSNQYAPEHLILQVDNARDYCDLITAAGSVFIGPWTPETVGDYASGTNHVLPTYGYAKSISGLGITDFMLSTTFQELSANGLRGLAETVMQLAAYEGLDAHKNAVQIRMEKLL